MTVVSLLTSLSNLLGTAGVEASRDRGETFTHLIHGKLSEVSNNAVDFLIGNRLRRLIALLELKS